MAILIKENFKRRLFFMEKNQKINCTVESCAFHNPNKECCELKAITVRACQNCHNGNPADESMCGNYECTNK